MRFIRPDVCSPIALNASSNAGFSLTTIQCDQYANKREKKDAADNS